jgi:hypothetical protein
LRSTNADKLHLITIFRLLIDVQSLNDRIGSINGAGDIGEYLLKLVNGKTILRPPSPVPTPSESNDPVTNGTGSAEPPKDEQKDSENNPGPPEKDVAAETRTMPEPGKRSLEKT